ncbi:Uncharacterized protein, UPF0548 family [Geodermatophilus dictyosporus]|uniref:Uncharacterized protein, UPF0548 family n=1 Tax=Geodermatophilus dictyosporus TaxID=1523247 RepID=A0A1I5TKB8_9ACTN|nr:DUF1990 domain-containing protein [Geodermatophilus dictyosporus]SFP83418.1 Uncharacterized protein, UPF0548 family [Geodermatophilus dictyosporus]
MGLLRAVSPADLRDTPLTYAEVGATGDAELPAGYLHGEWTEVVGSGRETLERVAAAVFDWTPQRSVGLRVRATGSPREVGTVVVLTAGLPRLGYDIPCRVVWAQPTGDERGFAYGTLPGHPESGEERFTVRLTGDGDVVATIRVFSRLATPVARAVPPVARLVQGLATRRYLSSLRRAATADAIRSTRSAGTGRP